MSACEELVQAALPEWSRRDIQSLIAAVDRRTAIELRTNPGLSFNEAAERARAALAEQIEAEAQTARLQTAKNAMRTLEGIGRVRKSSDKVKGLRALLIGTQEAEGLARSGAAQEQRVLHDAYTSGLLADVSNIDGGLALFTSGDIEDDIARALWQIDQPSQKLDGIPSQAVDLARVVRKWQDVARLDANEAGANIGKLDNYIVRQSHDPGSISADRAGWEAVAREEFDWARMGVEPDETQKVLDALWRDLSDGVHLKAGQSRPGRTMPKGVGRKLSKERVIHFKNADGWMRYNKEYGHGNLREAVLGGLDASAKATGLMRVLGPDHEQNYQRIVDAITRDLKESGGDVKAFETKAKRYKEWYIAELDGTTSIPGSDPLASFGSSVRALQSMSSLGGAALSSVSDLGTVALGARYHGGSAFEAMAMSAGNLFKGAKDAERLALYADLGVVMDSIASKITSGGRFSIEDGPRGWLGKAQTRFYQLNLQNRWTDAVKSGAAEFLSMNLARKADLKYDQLDNLKTTLGLYGIDAGKWDIIRSGALREYEGRQFLTPKALDDVPDEAFAAYLVGDAKPSRIRELRRDIQREMRMFLTDQRGYMVLEPDAAVSGALKMGTRRGTHVGEAFRFIMQFKSFSYAFTQRVLGRELKQAGMWGVARTLFATSMFGMAAMTMKDIVKGKKPRNPLDPRTIVAAIQQGGGAGLYSDLLFSQVVDRRYGDAGLQAFGPTVSDVFGSQGLAGLAARAVQGKDPSAAALRFAQSNTPFINLFYVKPMLDYAFFWHAQEAVNPGSLRRMEREMEQRSGQEYFISPAEAVR